MIGYLGVINLAKTTYQILSQVDTVSNKITDLINKSEFARQDRMNFQALERRLQAMTQTVNCMLIYKQNQENELRRLEDYTANKLKKQKDKGGDGGAADIAEDANQQVLIQKNSMDVKTIRLAEELLTEINEFIENLWQGQRDESEGGQAQGENQGGSLKQKKFDKDFRVELQHYL